MSRTIYVPLKIFCGAEVSAGTPFLSFTEYLPADNTKPLPLQMVTFSGSAATSRRCGKCPQALGPDLPEAARASRAYEGKPRLIVPSRRSVAEVGEVLTLRVIVLDNAPPRFAELRWRLLGRGDWQSLPLKRVARGVHTVTLSPVTDESIECYIEAKTDAGALLRWPATAPEMCQTIVVVPGR